MTALHQDVGLILCMCERQTLQTAVFSDEYDHPNGKVYLDAYLTRQTMPTISTEHRMWSEIACCDKKGKEWDQTIVDACLMVLASRHRNDSFASALMHAQPASDGLESWKSAPSRPGLQPPYPYLYFLWEREQRVWTGVQVDRGDGLIKVVAVMTPEEEDLEFPPEQQVKLRERVCHLIGHSRDPGQEVVGRAFDIPAGSNRGSWMIHLIGGLMGDHTWEDIEDYVDTLGVVKSKEKRT